MGSCDLGCGHANMRLIFNILLTLGHISYRLKFIVLVMTTKGGHYLRARVLVLGHGLNYQSYNKNANIYSLSGGSRNLGTGGGVV